MNGKKIKTKLMVLVICFFFLTSISGVSLAATVIDTNIGEKTLEIFEIKELNHAPAVSEYVPDEILVKFKSDTGNVLVSRTNSEYGASVKSTLLSGTRILRVPSDKTVDEMVKIYESLPEVEYAEPNYMVHALMIPNDTLYPYQWHLDNHMYGGIHMESAWDVSNGSGVVVAVLDTGVAQAPDLAGTTFVQGYDFVNGDTNPNDDHGHGTHVAGTIAQTTNNGYGVAGVAFGCSIMPIKVLNATGSGYDSWLADGIRYAVDHGADVISMSLGGSNPSSTIEDAVAYAYNHGVTVIAAAGNEYEEGNAPNYPAAYDDYVIAVGATRYDETRSYYSNTGSYLDLVAPGGDMTVDQNNDYYGDGVLQQTLGGSPPSFGFYFMQGTSMATPHVAGVAALVIAKGITGPDNVSALLKSSAEDKGAPGWDEEYGWGLVNAATALRVVQMTIPAAVDNYDLDWVTGGTAEWFGETWTYYYGGDAAESGDLTDYPYGQTSWMQTSVTGPGNLSFYWKVSSEAGHDFLRFYIDDVEQNNISGNTSWAQKTYSISSGTHTLKWQYSKDTSNSVGEDCGWVDKLEYGAVVEGNPDIWVDPTSFNVTLSTNTAQTYTLMIGNNGNANLTYNISDANATTSSLAKELDILVLGKSSSTSDNEVTRINALGGNVVLVEDSAIADLTSSDLEVCTWTAKTTMPSARFGAAAGVIDGVLYVAGGHDGTTGATSTLQAYNPTTNTWSTLASMPQGRYSGDGAGAINGKLYVTGGWNWPASGLPQSQLFVYDPVANSWSTNASLPILSGNGATGVIGGKLYVTTPCDGYSGYRKFLHVYDPATNTWSQLASSPNAHADPAFGVINNKLYVAGGTGDSGVHANLDVYDPATNTWTTKAPMPTSLTGLAGGVINDKFYAIGGSSAGVYYNTVYVYDPSTDTWTTKTSMPTARSGAVAGAINGVIYVAGGTNSAGTLATVEAFTPGDTWLTETPTSGSVASGSYNNITVSINTTGLSTGSYSANITISSNDPDEGTTIVPVSLTVSAEGGTGGLETTALNS
ncbi:MAG: S8 family serine peptidase, partial [Methanocellales archaeon]|nr:S8 family serine peptidase [Methanocellales archaeon]